MVLHDAENHHVRGPAGVYRDVQLRRWRSLLARTMWDFLEAGTVATVTWCPASARNRLRS